MTIVAIIIYNRYDNLKKWIQYWKRCDHTDCELVIIHNIHSQLGHIQFKNYCADNGVRYISRLNTGLDIGAFQDVCRGRMNLGAYDNLLWIADDFMPMQKDFVKQFTDKLTDGVGVVCAEISEEITKHIRTSGFLISKKTAQKIMFPAERITQRSQCYHFEHRGGNDTFYHQIINLRLKVVQVAPLATSPLWDTHRRAELNRSNEMKEAFALNPKVTFICPVYNTYPEIISSLICQTYKNWELILVHDGENSTGLAKLIETINDKRIIYIESPERKNTWGHYYRQLYLNEIKAGRISTDCEYIVITNADNYHLPIYIETMLQGFEDNPNAIATYCSKMIHSYLGFAVMDCRLERGYVDCAGVMVRKDYACEVGWRDIVSHSSDWTYFEDLIKKNGANRFALVNGCLLIHN